MSSENHLQETLQHMRGGNDLDRADAAAAATALADSAPDAELKKAFLVALGKKGETPQEIAAFAEVFRDLARDPGLSEFAADAIDVCGTGGDGAGTFNVSTAVAFTLASFGIPVFKHGNRSITSKCGSADLLEACGIPLQADPEQLRDGLGEVAFAFFFAPAFHPAFKEIMPVRKSLAAEGQRTVFNLLGPLINPGRPAHQLLGVFSPAWVAPLADSLDQLGLAAGAVVHCRIRDDLGLDELSTAGENHLSGLGRLKGKDCVFRAHDLSIPAADFNDLAGGDIQENIAILHALLRIDSARPLPAGLHNTVSLNAGTALWILGKAADPEAGFRSASEQLESGAVGRWLERARQFFAR